MTMTADFLVIGESVADIVREPGRPDATHPGGSPANVAYGLARLGRETALLTEPGADPAGELIAARLREAGVELLACRSQPADGGGTASGLGSAVKGRRVAVAFGRAPRPLWRHEIRAAARDTEIFRSSPDRRR